MKTEILTNHFYARAPRGTVPLETLNSIEVGAGLFGPDHAIDSETITVDGEQVETFIADAYGQIDFFPWSNSDESGDPLAEMLNKALFDRVGDTPPPADHASFELENVSLDPQPTLAIYYEDLICNAYYNVKTWRVQATASGVSIDETITAGDLAINGDPGTAPEDGKRSRYGAGCIFSDANMEGDKTLGVQITLGGGFLTRPIERLYANPVEYALLPDFRVSIGYSDTSDPEATTGGRYESVGTGSNQDDIDNGSLSSQANFLGQSIYMVNNQGDTFTYSLDITAEEFWTDDDQWLGAAE